MSDPRPKYFRDYLEDSLLAPPMTPALWESYGELAKRYPVIMGVIAYILDMAREDMMEMGTTLIETEAGKLKMSRLQGQMLSKQAVVGRICDLMGDLALSGESLEGDDITSDEDLVPSWAYPDDHEEEEKRERQSRYRRKPRPHARVAPKPPVRKTPKKRRR